MKSPKSQALVLLLTVGILMLAQIVGCATAPRPEPFLSTQGTINAVVRDNDRTLVTVDGKGLTNDSPAVIVAVVTKETTLLASDKGKADHTDLKIGAKVTVEYGTRLAKSNPPQGQAKSVLLISRAPAEAKPQPGDILSIAMRKAGEIDILSSLEMRFFELPPERPGWEKRKVSIARKQGLVVMISATEPTDSGKMTGRSTYYFHEGTLFYHRAPFNHMVFENGRIAVITDENMKRLSMPAEHLRQREIAVNEAIARYLTLLK